MLLAENRDEDQLYDLDVALGIIEAEVDDGPQPTEGSGRSSIEVAMIGSLGDLG